MALDRQEFPDNSNLETSRKNKMNIHQHVKFDFLEVEMLSPFISLSENFCIIDMKKMNSIFSK